MRELTFTKQIDPDVLGPALAGLIVPKSFSVSEAWSSGSVAIGDEKDLPPLDLSVVEAELAELAEVTESLAKLENRKTPEGRALTQLADVLRDRIESARRHYEERKTAARDLADVHAREVAKLIDAHVPARKRLVFTVKNDLSQLHDELLADVPALRPVPIPADELPPGLSNALRPVMTVEGAGDKIFLTVPADADENAIEKVTKDHVPKPPPPPPAKRAELRDRLKKATTTDDIKSVLDSVLDRIPD